MMAKETVPQTERKKGGRLDEKWEEKRGRGKEKKLVVQSASEVSETRWDTQLAQRSGILSETRWDTQLAQRSGILSETRWETQLARRSETRWDVL
jgi:hypothetical protein